jgi:hypothetical protein
LKQKGRKTNKKIKSTYTTEAKILTKKVAPTQTCETPLEQTVDYGIQKEMAKLCTFLEFC